MERGKTFIAALVFGTLLYAPGSAQVTQRANIDSNENQANGDSWSNAISGDGRFVAFESTASNLVPGDTNGTRDIFVRDRWLGTTERVSVSTAGAQSNGNDFFAPAISISANGRFVAFSSNASNLVSGDTNGKVDIFVRDRQLGTTERVSVDSNGVQGNGESRASALSADGRYVAFKSLATNLVAGDTNGWSDIFVRDRLAGTTERVSVSSAGVQGDSNAQDPVITADGRYVAFGSAASNISPGDTNGYMDVFVRDRLTGTTERVTHAFGGGPTDGPCSPASISADARFVAFEGMATNLVPGDNNGSSDAFVVDRQTGTIERVSVSTSGAEANQGIFMAEFPCPGMSADGRYVVFISASDNLIIGDSNTILDVFVRDRLLGTTQRASVGTEGVQGDGFSMWTSISADGRFVSFCSLSDNFEYDTNHALDIFVRDDNPTGFTSLCSPGIGGVHACPCSNPPSGAGRGCDNSSATGGAMLTALGVAYLSMETLRFTTSGERPTALSLVTQYTASNPTGAIFGMGVRCTSGTFKRLYTKQASGGSITAPDFSIGDPKVSVRSASLGSVIQPGESRWYIVSYRDPIVLGGCPAPGTFNATQTGLVTWSL